MNSIKEVIILFSILCISCQGYRLTKHVSPRALFYPSNLNRRLNSARNLADPNADNLFKELVNGNHPFLTECALLGIKDAYDDVSASLLNELKLKRFGDQTPVLDNFSNLGQPYKLTTWKLYVQNNENIYLAFRGTHTSEDMINDVGIVPGRLTNDIYIHGGIKLCIDNEFDFIMSEIDKEIEKITSETNEKKVFTIYPTGHSLGGGLAHAFGIIYNNKVRNKEIIETRYRLGQVYTFAAPQVVMKRSADIDPVIDIQSINFANPLDIVPRLPTILSQPSFFTKLEGEIPSTIRRFIGIIIRRAESMLDFKSINSSSITSIKYFQVFDIHTLNVLLPQQDTGVRKLERLTNVMYSPGLMEKFSVSGILQYHDTDLYINNLKNANLISKSIVYPTHPTAPVEPPPETSWWDQMTGWLPWK